MHLFLKLKHFEIENIFRNGNFFMKEKIISDDNGDICFYSILKKVDHKCTYETIKDAIIYFGQGIRSERVNTHFRDADEKRFCTDFCTINSKLIKEINDIWRSGKELWTVSSYKLVKTRYFWILRFGTSKITF